MPRVHVLLLLVLTVTARAQSAEPEILTRIAEVRDLTAERAAGSLPVKLRGVVAWKTAWGVTVQDDEAGTWLHMNEARARKVWQGDPKVLQRAKPGDILEIEGVTVPGAFAPGIMPTTLKLVGQATAPSPRQIAPERFFSGADDGILVEVKGVIQGLQQGDGAWIFRVNTNPGIIAVEFPARSLQTPENLLDAEVKVVGVATTRFNTRGEMTMPRVFAAQGEDLVIEKAATPAFAAPLIPLNRILAYNRLPPGPHRVRVRGVVTFVAPRECLYLQDGDTAVRVGTTSEEPVVPGDEVEVSGFPEMSRAIGGLVEAQVRRISAGTVPPAVTIAPEEIVRLNRDSLNYARRATPHDYDGHLITFSARLLTVQKLIEPRKTTRQLLAIRTGDVIAAELMGPQSELLEQLLPGSELKLTGIARLEYSTVDAPRSRLSLVPTRVSILLRGPDDVVVLSTPSWWTPSRLLAVVGVAALALLLALVWIWQLRRGVRLKTEQLAREIRARRDAAVEFEATIRERNRLAANLHDTLLQTLGGISFEIGACETEAGTRTPALLPRLAVVRRILDLAVSELRNSVWALRSHPLATAELSEALLAILARETTHKLTTYDLQLEGEVRGLPEFVAGNLILAAQEAIRNAVRHGEAGKITVKLTRDETNTVRVTISDDGRGFTPGEQRGPAQGHFGLVGMRERIERLEGKVVLNSAPGHGTKVILEVPVRAYDRTLS